MHYIAKATYGKFSADGRGNVDHTAVINAIEQLPTITNSADVKIAVYQTNGFDESICYVTTYSKYLADTAAP